jgi:hypothetical protein
MVSSITGPQSIESIWGQSGLVGAAKNAAASVAKAGASVNSALTASSNATQGGGTVFQSFSADLQALLVQQQNVANSAKPATTGNDPASAPALSQISKELGQSMQLFGGSAASAATMTTQVTQSALQSLQALG